MARRAAFSQAYCDRAAAAVAKLGWRPEFVFDLENGKVIVRAADEAAPPRSTWQDKAPDRV